MAAGMAISKAEIDARVGDICRQHQKLAGDVATMKSFFDQTPDQDLIDLQYTATDVANMKTAFTDLALFWLQIWPGLAALAAAYDFRTFVRVLWGVGSF